MSNQPPFRILGLQQVAIGSSDKSVLGALWVDLLGVEKVATSKNELENVNEDILVLGEKPFHVEINLMQPIDPKKKPKVSEPPLNHIGFWIDNLKIAYEWLPKQGVRLAPLGIRKGSSGYDVCFIHPKSNEEYPISGNGVLIELIQAPKEISKAYEDQLHI